MPEDFFTEDAFCFLFFNLQNVRRYIWHREIVDYNPAVCFTIGYDAQSFAGLSEFSTEECGSDEKGSWQNKHSRFTKNGKYSGTKIMHLECLLFLICFFSSLLCLLWHHDWWWPGPGNLDEAFFYRNSTDKFSKPKYTEMSTILCKCFILNCSCVVGRHPVVKCYLKIPWQTVCFSYFCAQM